jgi:hypothetical protein
VAADHGAVLSPRTRKLARPNVQTPAARAAGISDLEIVADSHERYPYRFADQQVTVVRRALPCGDYGLAFGGHIWSRRWNASPWPTWRRA